MAELIAEKSKTKSKKKSKKSKHKENEIGTRHGTDPLREGKQMKKKKSKKVKSQLHEADVAASSPVVAAIESKILRMAEALAGQPVHTEAEATEAPARRDISDESDDDFNPGLPGTQDMPRSESAAGKGKGASKVEHRHAFKASASEAAVQKPKKKRKREVLASPPQAAHETTREPLQALSEAGESPARKRTMHTQGLHRSNDAAAARKELKKNAAEDSVKPELSAPAAVSTGRAPLPNTRPAGRRRAQSPEVASPERTDVEKTQEAAPATSRRSHRSDLNDILNRLTATMPGPQSAPAGAAQQNTARDDTEAIDQTPEVAAVADPSEAKKAEPAAASAKKARPSDGPFKPLTGRKIRVALVSDEEDDDDQDIPAPAAKVAPKVPVPSPQQPAAGTTATSSPARPSWRRKKPPASAVMQSRGGSSKKVPDTGTQAPTTTNVKAAADPHAPPTTDAPLDADTANDQRGSGASEPGHGRSGNEKRGLLHERDSSGQNVANGAVQARTTARGAKQKTPNQLPGSAKRPVQGKMEGAAEAPAGLETAAETGKVAAAQEPGAAAHVRAADGPEPAADDDAEPVTARKFNVRVVRERPAGSVRTGVAEVSEAGARSTAPLLRHEPGGAPALDELTQKQIDDNADMAEKMLKNLLLAKKEPGAMEVNKDDVPPPKALCAALHDVLQSVDWETVRARTSYRSAMLLLGYSEESITGMKAAVYPIIKAELKRLGAFKDHICDLLSLRCLLVVRPKLKRALIYAEGVLLMGTFPMLGADAQRLEQLNNAGTALSPRIQRIITDAAAGPSTAAAAVVQSDTPTTHASHASDIAEVRSQPQPTASPLKPTQAPAGAPDAAAPAGDIAVGTGAVRAVDFVPVAHASQSQSLLGSVVPETQSGDNAFDPQMPQASHDVPVGASATPVADAGQAAPGERTAPAAFVEAAQKYRLSRTNAKAAAAAKSIMPWQANASRRSNGAARSRRATGGAAALAAIGLAPEPGPAPAPLHFPHTHLRVQEWCNIGLLTEYPGCFERYVVRRLRSLRAAATLEDGDAVFRLKAWYKAPNSGKAGMAAGAVGGPRVTRRQRQAQLLAVITQDLRSLAPGDQGPALRSPAGTSCAHTADAAEALQMMAGACGVSQDTTSPRKRDAELHDAASEPPGITGFVTRQKSLRRSSRLHIPSSNTPTPLLSPSRGSPARAATPPASAPAAGAQSVAAGVPEPRPAPSGDGAGAPAAGTTLASPAGAAAEVELSLEALPRRGRPASSTQAVRQPALPATSPPDMAMTRPSDSATRKHAERTRTAGRENCPKGAAHPADQDQEAAPTAEMSSKGLAKTGLSARGGDDMVGGAQATEPCRETSPHAEMSMQELPQRSARSAADRHRAGAALALPGSGGRGELKTTNGRGRAVAKRPGRVRTRRSSAHMTPRSSRSPPGGRADGDAGGSGGGIGTGGDADVSTRDGRSGDRDEDGQERRISPPTLAPVLQPRASSAATPSFKVTPPHLQPPARSAPPAAEDMTPALPQRTAQAGPSPSLVAAAAPRSPTQHASPDAAVHPAPAAPLQARQQPQPGPGVAAPLLSAGLGSADHAASAPVRGIVPAASMSWRAQCGGQPALAHEPPHHLASAPARINDAVGALAHSHTLPPFASAMVHPPAVMSPYAPRRAVFALVSAMRIVQSTAVPVSPIASSGRRHSTQHMCATPNTEEHSLPFRCAAAGHIRAAASQMHDTSTRGRDPAPCGARGPEECGSGHEGAAMAAASLPGGGKAGAGARDRSGSSAWVAAGFEDEVANLLDPLARLIEDPPEGVSAALHAIAANLDTESAQPRPGRAPEPVPTRINGTAGAVGATLAGSHSAVSHGDAERGSAVDSTRGAAAVSLAMRAIAFCVRQPDARALLMRWLQEMSEEGHGPSSGDCVLADWMGIAQGATLHYPAAVAGEVLSCIANVLECDSAAALRVAMRLARAAGGQS